MCEIFTLCAKIRYFVVLVCGLIFVLVSNTSRSSVRYIWWQRWDPLPASRRQGPRVDAAEAGEYKCASADHQNAECWIGS